MISKVPPRWMKRAACALSLGALVLAEPLAGCAASNTSAIQSRISGMLVGSERESAEKAVSTALSHAPLESRQTISAIPENLDEGRSLAIELGHEGNDLNAVNFAYAISAIGETAAREMHDSLGIRFFMRYSRATLQEVRLNMSSSDSRPLLLAAFNQNDWNGAFYREGMGLEQLTRHYRLLVIEADGEDRLYGRMKRVGSEHGRIAALVIGGHGQPESVQLGEQSEEGRLDNSDEAELHALRSLFSERPMVVMISCSTGESESAVGGMVSRALNAVVFAPVTPSSRTYFHFGADGAIEGVTYDVDVRRYSP